MTETEKNIVDQLMEETDRLSPREFEFVEDLQQTYQERELSEKQWDWLNDISVRIL